MGPQTILHSRPDLKTSLLLILATALVLLVVMHPITAELTGRAGDRRDAAQLKKDVARLKAEKDALQERYDKFEMWTRDQISYYNRYVVQTHSDIKDIKCSIEAVKGQFDSVGRIWKWIDASNSKRR